MHRRWEVIMLCVFHRSLLASVMLLSACSSAGGRTDSGVDGRDGGDAGSLGSAVAVDWSECPNGVQAPRLTPRQDVITVTEAAEYCAMFVEGRTLAEQSRAKAVLRIAPGSYGLPRSDSEPWRMPACVYQLPSTYWFAEGDAVLAVDPGAPDVYVIAQQMRSEQGVSTLEATFSLPTALQGGREVLLNGTASNVFDEETFRYRFTLSPACGEQGCSDVPTSFESCTFATFPTLEDSVAFDGGDATFSTRFGDAFSGTEPGAFVRAIGTFRGVGFDQRSYWSLLYTAGHHHMPRSFGVLFEAPIEGACGLEVRGFADVGRVEAVEVDCALEHKRTLSVQAYSIQRAR
jgi:hypothetical protein